MKNHSPDNQPLQNAGRDADIVGKDKITAGRDNITAGRDNITSTNINIWMPFLLVGVLALGGVAWAINTGFLRDSGNPQQPNSSLNKTNTSK
jgi:hypothetical protein